jgi:hypothetical protein
MRIPGLWFMVHSFFSLILLLAGIVVILLTAWRMRRQHLGQAEQVTCEGCGQELTEAAREFLEDVSGMESKKGDW